MIAVIGVGPSRRVRFRTRFVPQSGLRFAPRSEPAAVSPTEPAQELSYRRFLAYAALAVAVAIAPILIWRLAFVLVMGYAAILVAILLHVASEPLQRWTPLSVWLDLIAAR